MSQLLRPAAARAPDQSPHDNQTAAPLSPQQPPTAQRPHSARPLHHATAPPPPSPMHGHQYNAARAVLAAHSISLSDGHSASSSARPIPRSASFSSFDGSSRVLTARELRSYERSDGLTIESGYEEPPEGDAAASARSGALGAMGGRRRPVLLSTPRRVDASLVERSPIPLSIHTIPLDAIAVPQWRRAAERQQAQALRDAAIATVAEEDSSERLRENRSVSDSSVLPTASAVATPADQDHEEHAPTLARRASLAVFQSLAVQKLAQEAADELSLEDFIQSSKQMLPLHTPVALDLCGPDAEQVLSRWVSDTLDIDAGNLIAVQVVAPAPDHHHHVHPLSAPTTSPTSSTSANYPHYSGDAVSLVIDASIAPPKLAGVVKVFSVAKNFEKELLALTRMHAWLDPPGASASAAAAVADAQTQPQQSAGDAAAVAGAASATAATATPPTPAPAPSCPRIIRVPTAIGAHFALTPAGKGGVLVMTPADGLPLDDYFVSLSRATAAAAAAAAAHGQAADREPLPLHAERHELFAQLLDAIRLAATAFFELHTIPRGSGGKVKKHYIQQYVTQSQNIIVRIREKLGDPPGAAVPVADSGSGTDRGIGAAVAGGASPASASSTTSVAVASGAGAGTGTGTLPEAGEIWSRFSSHQHLLDATSLSARLQPLVQAALQSRGLSCVVHGDAHLGNVFYDPAARCITLIDVPCVNASVGERGEPIGCAARDVANFVHKIHLASLAHACAPKESLQLQAAFLDTYRAHFHESGLPLALSMETYHFFLIRSLLGEMHRGLKDHSLGLATVQALEHALIDAELFLHRRQDLGGRAALPLRLAPRPGDNRAGNNGHGAADRSGPGCPVDDGGDDDDVQDDALALQLHDEELEQEALAEAERLKNEAARMEMREQDALNEAGAPGLGNEDDEERDLFDQDDDQDEAQLQGPYTMALGPAAFAQAGSCVSDVNDHAQMYAFSPAMPHRPPVRRLDSALPPLALGAADADAIVKQRQQQQQQQQLYPPHSPSSMYRQQSAATPSYPSGGALALAHPSYPSYHPSPSAGLYSSINGGRILVVLGAPLKADQTPDVWLESRLKQSVAIFYRMVGSGLNALVLAGGRNPGMEVSTAKVMERWLRPYGVRSNSSRFLLLNEDMSSCTSAESYPRDLVSQAFCIRSLLRVRGFRHGNLLVICNDFQLALVASCMNRVFRSGTGLVALEYIGAPTVRAYAPSAGVEAARLKELPVLMREMRPAFQQFFPYGRCGLLDACRAGSMQTLRLILDGQPGAAAGADAATLLVNTERDGLGCSGLHIAAECGFADLCAYLLQRGADPNARSTLGATPLHYATALGRLDVVELLLEFGAGPSRSLKGGCGRGCWLGSRRPCDMHRNGPSPMLAASTHLVQEAQPQWSTITCLVQPEAMPLAEAEADIRREHDEDNARRRRAAGAMHRSASTNKLSHSRAGSGDGNFSALTSHTTTPTGRHGSGMDAHATGVSRVDPPSNPPSVPSSPRQGQGAGSAEGSGQSAHISKEETSASDAHLAAAEQLQWISGPLPPPLSLYPSLRSKRVLLLRHSESLWNVNGSHRVRGLIDTTLTNMGVKQARQLRALLQRTGALQRLGVRLVAVSPLTRTLQTYMLAVRWFLDLFPNAPALPAPTTAPGSAIHTPASSVAGHASAHDSHLAVPPFESASPRLNPSGAPCPVRVVVRAELAEQLLSTGTIGRAPDQLAKDFGDPSLDFSSLEPIWWYAPDRDDAAAGAGGVGGAEGVAAAAVTTAGSASNSSGSVAASVSVPAPPANTRIYLKREPIERLRRRIHRFLYWLDQQPESSVLVVGHGTYFREMVDAAHAYTDVFKANLFIWRM